MLVTVTVTVPEEAVVGEASDETIDFVKLHGMPGAGRDGGIICLLRKQR